MPASGSDSAPWARRRSRGTRSSAASAARCSAARPRPRPSRCPLMAQAPIVDTATAERTLVDLLALECELLELEYVRRADALERASEAARRLGELGSTEGI